MKTRILGMAIGLGALWAWSPGCSQPKPECNVGSASAYGYIAKLTLISGDETCNPAYLDSGGFEEVGMQAYNPVGSDGKTPDTTKKLVALQTLTLGNYLQNAIELEDGSAAYSYGEFSDANPDESNICTAANLSPAHMVLPLVPGEGGSGGGPPPNAQEPADITISWDTVTWYVTAANMGNQAEGTMTYRDNLAGCEATYRALMLWPIVGCEEILYLTPTDRTVDMDGNLVNPCNPLEDIEGTCAPCDPASDDEFCEARQTGRPNNALCDGEADPEPPYEIPTGSGISPDLTVTCDPVLLTCFLAPEQIQRPQD